MKKIKFEEAMAELEKIVENLEQGELSLEEALKRFEEGIKLSRFCAKRLDEVEKKVEILLTEEGDKTKPFDISK